MDLVINEICNNENKNNDMIFMKINWKKMFYLQS